MAAQYNTIKKLALRQNLEENVDYVQNDSSSRRYRATLSWSWDRGRVCRAWLRVVCRR